MGGGGNDYKVKDTEAEKELAAIAKEKWELYNEKFVPLENKWMKDIETWNKKAAYDQAAGVGVAETNSAYGKALEDQMAAGGNIGRIGSSIDRMSTAQGNDASDSANRMQINQQNRYTSGMQAIAAQGQGKQAGAIRGLAESASIAGGYARQQARNEYQKDSANNELIGAGVGAASRWGIS